MAARHVGSPLFAAFDGGLLRCPSMAAFLQLMIALVLARRVQLLCFMLATMLACQLKVIKL